MQGEDANDTSSFQGVDILIIIAITVGGEYSDSFDALHDRSTAAILRTRKKTFAADAEGKVVPKKIDC